MLSDKTKRLEKDRKSNHRWEEKKLALVSDKNIKSSKKETAKSSGWLEAEKDEKEKQSFVQDISSHLTAINLQNFLLQFQPITE